MRLTCPNCNAQYEIDAALIPDSGRDVQCSNCSNTWFATKPVPPDVTPEALDWDAAEAAPVDDEDDILDDEAAEAEAPWRESVAEPAPDLQRPQQRRVDPAALDILREEADREIAQRQGEPAAMETQSEVALDEEVEDEIPSRAWRARVSRIEDADAIEKRAKELDEKAAYTEQKSELLPDIEDINSSLAPTVTTSGSRGFRWGFAVSFGVPVLLLALYSMGPTLAQLFPSTEGFFVAYLDVANGLRALIGGL